MIRHLIVLVAATLPLAIGAVPVAGVTLDEAVQAAWAHHPSSVLPEARRQVADGYHAQSDAWFSEDPAVFVDYQSDQTGSDDGFRELNGSVELPLWLPGQARARHALGDGWNSVADAEAARLLWEIHGEVVDRLIAVREAGSAAALARTQLEAARVLENTVARRVEMGELARSELLLIRQATISRELILDDANSMMEKTEAAWRSYTGLDAVPELPQLPELAGGLRSDHPRLRLARAQAELARSGVEDVRRSRRAAPTLFLYSRRDRATNADPYNESLGVGMRVPLGTRSANAPRLAEAAAAMTEAQVALARLEQELALDVEQAATELARARKALTLAASQDEISRTRLVMSQRAFDLGETDLFLLLAAREQAASAEREHQSAGLAVQRAIARYNLNLGAMLK